MGKTNLLQQAAASATGRQAAAEQAAEQARIGAAAERKRRREADESNAAILSSAEHGGRAVYWERSIYADGEIRPVTMVERSGAYSERGFLRLVETAAEQAGRGRWRRPEAVEAVAAELVVRILAKTQGRLPQRGSLGRHGEGRHENPDLAYLTASASRLIASATRGDADAAGLAAEAASSAVSMEDETAAPLSVGELLSEAAATAEGTPDPYLADGEGDYLSAPMREAAENLATIDGRRPRATLVATVQALRPSLLSAELADAGYGASPGAVRKAAHSGRESLCRVIARLEAVPVSAWRDADWRAAESLGTLSAEDESATGADHLLMEQAPAPAYRAPKREWADDCNPIPRAER